MYKKKVKLKGSSDKMKKGKVVAYVLALALTVTSVCVPAGSADAAKKASLNKKKETVEVGGTVKLSVKNGVKKAKVTWKTSNKKVAKITKKTAKGKSASATVKGVKKGSAKITAVYKLGKKKTNLKCKITVVEAGSETQATQGPVQSAAASAAPTSEADNKQTTAPTSSVQTNAPKTTTKPTTRPRVTQKPSTPTPSPTPYLVNSYTVDLSDPSIVAGENGGSAVYNPETKAIENNQFAGMTGFIINNPATENRSEYKYVTVTYFLEGGDVNIYLGAEGAGSGQDAAGWSGEIKLNQYEMGKEVTILLDANQYIDGAYIAALKLFNFGQETKISISDITFYMDGKTNKQEDYIARTLKDETVTVDGVASDDEGWSEAREYKFLSKIAAGTGDSRTDSAAAVKFMHDEDNLYFYIDVKDSSIDNTSANNFEQDGLEILFDEDNCRKTGAGSADWTDNKDGLHYRFTGLNKDSEVKTGLTAATQNGAVGGGEDGKKIAVDIKYALTDKGYSIEAKIPFAAKKASGDKVSLDLIIQDCKGGSRINEFYMYPTTEAKGYWNNESADFGTLILGQKA